MGTIPTATQAPLPFLDAVTYVCTQYNGTNIGSGLDLECVVLHSRACMLHAILDGLSGVFRPRKTKHAMQLLLVATPAPTVHLLTGA